MVFTKQLFYSFKGHLLILTSNIAHIIFLSPERIALSCCWSARYKRFYNFLILYYTRLKTLSIVFFFLLRLLNGLVFIEIAWTQTAIRAFRAMRINPIQAGLFLNHIVPPSPPVSPLFVVQLPLNLAC